MAGGRSPNARRAARAADPRRLQLADEPVLSVASPRLRAAMEDRRLAAGHGQRKVPPEVRELRIERREPTIRIEPGLADRHDPRVRGQRDDPVPASLVDLGSGVRVDADRCIEPRESVDERQGID